MNHDDDRGVTVTSLRRRLILVFSGFTLAITATFTTINLIHDIQALRERTTGKSRLLASLLASNARLPLFANDLPTLQRLATEIADVRDVRTVVIANARGEAVATGGPLSRSAPGNAIRQVKQVLPQGTDDGAARALGLPADNQPPLGSVTVIMEGAILQQQIRNQIAIALVTATVIWLAFTYLSTLIVRWAANALAPLIDGLRQIQTGAFGTRIPPSRFSELNDATAAVNELGHALAQRDTEIRRLHQELLDAMQSEVREERRRMMAKLIHTNRMTSLGLLASSMAHELNTPNGAIRLAAQQIARIWGETVPLLDRIAEEEGDFTLGGMNYSLVRQETSRGIETIGRSSERISRVISDLREFSVGERSAATLPVRVDQVVQDALSIIRASGKGGESAIRSHVAPDMPPVRGNRYQMEQVFINLILNGLQAIPPDREGEVTVSADHDRETGRVTVSIRDNGTGIPEEIRERLFEPFFTTRLQEGGSGLGLYIASHIVAGHGGVLSLESTPGAGTTVTVSLPVAD